MNTVNLEISKLHPFEDHPYKVLDNEDMQALTDSIPELLNMMDEGKIAFSVGVELSYLDDRLQYDVLSFCEEMDCAPSYSQSWHLHQMLRDGTLDRTAIYDVLSQEKPNQREVIKIPMARIKDKLPSRLTAQQQEDFIVKAVEHYQKFLKKQREHAR